jgi:hypothetical protein
MTVKELIALLSEYDEDKEVYVCVASGREWGPAFEIKEDDRGMIVIQDNPSGGFAGSDGV